MMVRGAGLAACLIVLATEAGAAAPIPVDKRIAATVARTLAVPTTQPMRMPTDIVVDREGRAFVADGVNDRIVRFSPNGQFDGVIAAPGGQALNRPVGVGVDGQGRLWITDTGNHRVVVVLSDGKLAERIELPAAEPNRPFTPTDIAVTADGKRAYIVDNHNHRVAIRENAGGTLNFLGKFGEGLGQFRWPFMVCIEPDGYVYVSEAIGARVQRISPTDRWAGQVGRWGVELGEFYRSKGVAADTSGRLYVSDSTLGVIQVFDSRGATVGVLADPRDDLLRFQHPMGMCFDKAGRLYVVELGADRVAIIAIRWSERASTQRAQDDGAGGRP